MVLEWVRQHPDYSPSQVHAVEGLVLSVFAFSSHSLPPAGPSRAHLSSRNAPFGFEVLIVVLLLQGQKIAQILTE